tara:strand:- start:165 stop:443 length:279 start_codon:yes stop_codon:yes gene_type:complete
MTTYGQKLGSGWSPAGISDVWGSKLPGDYMAAGHSYGADDKWAMDRGYGKLFQGAENKGVGSFQEFMNLKKNPNSLFSNIVGKGSLILFLPK